MLLLLVKVVRESQPFLNYFWEYWNHRWVAFSLMMWMYADWILQAFEKILDWYFLMMRYLMELFGIILHLEESGLQAEM